MRNVLKDVYIPFGSQYYRAPSPHPDEWVKDIQKMEELGFNMVKFWVQWRWNHPTEDTFFFDDIDRLMDLSYAHRLKVMLNIIFDVAPAWIYHRYPDASMVTLDGRRIGPQTQPHRQIGGLGYCYNHDGVMEHFFRFLKQTVKHFKKHPALAIWNVGSEPELTSSMAEMRLYADNAEKMGNMLCYCDHCIRKFRIWLEEKYGDIEQLNKVWNRNYCSFDAVEVPKTRNTFNDMIDWRMFFVHVLGENIKRRFQVAGKEDSGMHPLMCHHVFIQGFPVTSTANDPWNVGKYGDLHGFTQMDDAMMIDMLRSCAKDKPVISAEMLMLPGYTLDLAPSIDVNDVKRFIFSGIAGNLKGFIFWQYRPEILGREAPAWGLTTLNGEPTPWLNAFVEVGSVLQNNADFFLEAKPDRAKIAILYNPENQIFAWASTGNEKNATNSLLGTHRALYERNFIVDFIHPIELNDNILNQYEILYIPFPYVLNKKICESIRNWVHVGGVVIGECYFGAWNAENGHHEKIIPGYDLHKVFQSRQGTVEPAGEDGSVEIIVDKESPYLSKDMKVYGDMVKAQLIPEGAEVLARFDTGEAAVTIGSYGKGKAVLIGTYLGLVYHRKHVFGNGAFIASLVSMNSNIEKPHILNDERVRVDIMRGRNDDVGLIVQNLEDEAVDVTVQLPIQGIGRDFEELFDRCKIQTVSDASGIRISVALDPREVRIYRA